MLKHGSSVARAIIALNNALGLNTVARGLLRSNEDKLEIHYYGLHREGEAISDILSANNVFLQEPDRTSAPYFNPQSLTDPHEFSAGLSEYEKYWEGGSLVIQQAIAAGLSDVFDSPGDPHQYEKLDINDKLITPLKRYLTREASTCLF